MNHVFGLNMQTMINNT